MKIAIFGATSQIAKDLIISFSNEKNINFYLFARRPEEVVLWLDKAHLSLNRYIVKDFNGFGDENFDVLINFVGIGSPEQRFTMGASIFDVTDYFDRLALNYLKIHSDCKYIFLSSGAVYGSNFESPVDENSVSTINLNNLTSNDWYGIAKLHAEIGHRSLNKYNIVDIRIFNYFSRTSNLKSNFFITDIIRSIKEKSLLEVSSDFIVRDFIHPFDFYQLIKLVIGASFINSSIDCYSKSPIDKNEILKTMQEHFGLQYRISKNLSTSNGSKPYYYSTNKWASKLGFMPHFTSLECLVMESQYFLND